MESQQDNNFRVTPEGTYNKHKRKLIFNPWCQTIAWISQFRGLLCMAPEEGTNISKPEIRAPRTQELLYDPERKVINGPYY